MTTKKETDVKTFIENNPWTEWTKMYNVQNYQQYYGQWLDAMDTYQSHVMNMQKMMIERTGQAWEEGYKIAKEGLNRSAEFVEFLHTMGTTQMKQLRQTINT